MEQRDSVLCKPVVRINIGGTGFKCFAKTLKTFPESKLADIEKYAEHYDFENKEYFFDRNPLCFEYILDACRKGAVHLPKDMCGATFKEDLDYWEISPRHVAPCCWEALYKSDGDVSVVRKLLTLLKERTNVCLLLGQHDSWRERAWLFLDEPRSSKPATVWVTFISLLVIASVLLTGLSMLPGLTLEYSESEKEVVKKIGYLLNWDNKTLTAVEGMKPHPWFIYTGIIVHGILTLEFIISFLVCPKKKFFVKSVSRNAFVLGYIAYWISFIMEMNLPELHSVHSIRFFLVLKYITILKLARLFYLTKRIPAFNILKLTYSSSKQEIKILSFLFGMLVCVFGYVMFVAEFFQNSSISNVFMGMYWALITLTTVGYGDYVPETIFGHVIAGACAVCGVIVIALPVGVIASSFSTFYNYHKYVERHVQLYGKHSCTCRLSQAFPFKSDSDK